MKVFLYTLLRTAVFIVVALGVYYFFGWYRWGVIGAVLSAVVGAVVAFAVGYLLFDRQRRAAAEQLGDAVQRRREATRPRSTAADQEAEFEDRIQDEQRAQRGLQQDARTPNPADDEG